MEGFDRFLQIPGQSLAAGVCAEALEVRRSARQPDTRKAVYEWYKDNKQRELTRAAHSKFTDAVAGQGQIAYSFEEEQQYDKAVEIYRNLSPIPENRVNRLFAPLTPALAVVLALVTLAPAGDTAPLELTLRSRAAASGKESAPAVEKKAAWDPKKTAVIVCDMWDRHWCQSAERRVGELAGPMNDMLKAARAKGVFVIHAPSTCTGFYKDTPQRRRARNAPFAPTPVPLAATERWGTAWNWPDAKREGVLPIDDSDMGCDCKVKCEIRSPWTRQTAAIEIADADAITDDGQETWNLLAERKIDNVILCGVHLNMCVLGRPFAIRQMVRLGKNVALIRDMTDTMYNPDRPPGGTHFAGTDRVVEHVERYWCPSFLSSDLTGKPTFRFKDAPASR